MVDLISRQAAIRFIRDKVSLSLFMKRSVDKADKACMELCDMLDRDLPTAHPKKGKWVRITKQHKDDEQEYSYYEISCSECGAIRKIGWHDARFCPNCGARMVSENG